MKRVIYALTLLAVLAGCTTLKPVAGLQTDWQARQEQLQALSRWELKARIAVRYESDGGQGNMNWKQDGAQSRIVLSGPFGTGAYRITWDPESVTVTAKNGEQRLRYTGSDAAEQFLRDHLGWSFPAGSTRYWLLGMLDPQYEGREVFDDEGRLTGLEQNGWTVSYQRFVKEGGLLLPGKMAIENADARLRLAIHGWEL